MGGQTGLGKTLAERYRRGSRPRGKPRSAAGGAGAPHLPLLRGTFLSRRRNGRHAPAPLDPSRLQGDCNRATVGRLFMAWSRARLWGGSRCGRSAPSGARRPVSQPYRCACTRARASAPALSVSVSRCRRRASPPSRRLRLGVLPPGPGEEGTSTSQGRPRTVFARALQNGNPSSPRRRRENSAGSAWPRRSS